LIETCEPIAASLKSELDTFTSGGVEALTWGEQGPVVQAMQSGRAAFGVVFLIMLLMAGLIIINTMLMTVMERTQEFGMLSALGMRGSNILFMVVSEGLAIGLIGATVGGLLGSGISVVVERTGIDLTRAMGRIEFPIEGVLYPDWQLSYTVIGMVLGLVVAGLAALYPAWRAVRMEPAEALRS